MEELRVDHIPHPTFHDLHGELTELMALGCRWTGASAYIEDPRDVVSRIIELQRMMYEYAAAGRGWPEKDGAPVEPLIRTYVTHQQLERFYRLGENPTTRASLHRAGVLAREILGLFKEGLSEDWETRKTGFYARSRRLGGRLASGAETAAKVFRTKWTFLDALEVPRPPAHPKRRGAPPKENPAWKRLAQLIRENGVAQKHQWIALVRFEHEGLFSSVRSAAGELRCHRDDPEVSDVEARKHPQTGRWEGRVRQSP